MEEKLHDALLCFNCLQAENYNGKSHDLEPMQERIRQILNGMELRNGLVRLRIECQPEVRSLRNKLDNDSNYGSNIQPIARAGKMRPDVLELMARRDAAARELGYTGYDEAILGADGLSREWLMELLNGYLDIHLSDVAQRAWAAELAMTDWFRWLGGENALEDCYEPMPLLREFAQLLGMEEILERIEIRTADSFCYAAQTSGSHIVMQISPIGDVDSWNTLFHEFGHACVYGNLPENGLPWLSPLVDEAIAVLFENAAVRLLAQAPLRTRALSVLHTEYTRTCISGLYELELWQNREKPEELYAQWYSRLGVKLEPERWALDSFRSIDCMTIFAYTIGQILADSLTDEKLVRVLPEIVKHAADMTLKELVERVTWEN